MNKISADREKKLTELGAKSRTGTLMSSLFRAVASECTEVILIKVPGDNTGKMEARLVSKAEAIVRDIMEKALPHRPEDFIGGILDSKEQLEYRKLVLDRVDGKTGAVGEDSKGFGETIPDKISRINKDFLNEQATKTKKQGPPVTQGVNSD